MYKILIVEDDKLLNEGVAFSLKKNGFDVVSAFCAEDIEDYNYENIDLILLDVNLSGKSGIELCRYIRKKYNVPIIFLTVKNTEKDILEGFRSGADDYITKPFSLLVLQERINAIFRRSSKDKKNVYINNDLYFDFDKMHFSKNNKELSLTRTESKILYLFIKNKGTVLTRLKIIENIWDINGEFIDENTLNVNIRRLRRKIEDDSSNPKYIKTVFGVGYIWSDEK